MGDVAHRTCLEIQMAGYLHELKLDFSEQYPLRTGSILDFLVQFKRKDGSIFSVNLETDGSEWHHTKSQRLRDLMRDKNTHALGIEVVRFREGFNFHQVYGTLQQICRRNGVIDFPKFPETLGE